MSELSQARATIQHLAESISGHLDLEVEVVDADLNRVGGTGKFRRLIGTRQERGYVNRHVMETGRPLVINHPGLEEHCRPCDLKGQCTYPAGVVCPIVHRDHVVGVLCLMGLSAGERKFIDSGGQRMLELIAQVSSRLLASQVCDRSPPEELPDSTVRPGAEDPFACLLGQSRQVTELKEKAFRAARGLATVLISGETGTGKELLARAIHRASSLGTGPLVTVNCSAIPDPLLESELFGYEEGAFTGARRGGKQGKFELADGGTVFLDEVGDLPLPLQPKLLRVLEDRVVDRVGSTRGRPVRTRIIAATNRDLAVLVRRGEFRSDLFYRLKVIPLHIPPLRERREDIPVLAEWFLREVDRGTDWGTDRGSDRGMDRGSDRGTDRKQRRWSAEAMALLKDYEWPGNVRELRNVVEYAATMETGREVMVDSLPADLRWGGCPEDGQAGLSLHERIMRYERVLVRQALETYGTTPEGKQKAARSLGVSLATFYRRLREFGISSDPT